MSQIKEKIMMIHGPSVVIGAGITAVVIVAVFFGLSSNNQPEIELVPADIPEPQVSLVALTSNGSPFLGDPNAKVTLVEFGDYQCFFCNKFFHETEHKIFTDYIQTGKVKLMFKDFTIIGPDSIAAAHGTHCANEQGKFWEYHDILYNNWTGENNGWASSENLLGFARDVNLDIDKWSDCMLESRYQSQLVASNEDAKSLQLTGTPAFFIIGPDDHITKISGAHPFETFSEIFESELAK